MINIFLSNPGSKFVEVVKVAVTLLITSCNQYKYIQRYKQALKIYLTVSCNELAKKCLLEIVSEIIIK